MITVSALRDLSGIRHGFLTRQGGVSGGNFASLNCSLSSGDDPGQVRVNRARALAQLGIDSCPLVLVQQQHTDNVCLVDSPISPEETPVADALVTCRSGLVLGILTADCAPVLLADGDAHVVAAVHAGWRGACGKIVENTLEAMYSLGADPKNIAAAIGPCIAQRSYEVGEDFVDNLLSIDPENQCFLTLGHKNERRFFDLPGYVYKKLHGLGVKKIEAASHDTFLDKENFFSYRRSSLENNKTTGRQMSLIFIES